MPSMRSRSRVVLVTDERFQQLPDVAPGAMCERLIRPQVFCVLHRIRVGITLTGLRVGPVEVPVALETAEGTARLYRLPEATPEIQAQLLRAGLNPLGSTIGLLPGIDVRLALRNDEDRPKNPDVAILVQLEEPR